MADDRDAFEELPGGDPESRGKILAIDGLLRELARRREGGAEGSVDRVVRALDGTAAPGEPTPEVSGRSVPGRVLGWLGSRWQIAAAAILFFAILGALLYRVGREGGVSYEVVSGRVRVEGVESSRVPAGAPVRVEGASPAEIRLEDGSLAEFAPSSEVVFHGPADRVREIVELVRGRGRFRVRKGPFQVVTPVGTVTGLAADFAVEVPGTPEGGPAPALRVDVEEGAVQVDCAGKAVVLSEGESCSFPPGKPEGGDYERLLKGAKITLVEAVRKALQEAGDGGAVEASLEDEDGKVLFSIDVSRGGRTLEIDIDPVSGEVRAKKPEDKDSSRVLKASGITLLQAVETALQKVPGLAVAALLEVEKGKVEAEVKVFSEGRVSKVEIDGRTGEVLRVEEPGRKGKGRKGGRDDDDDD